MTSDTTIAQVEKITPLTDSILQLILTPAHFIDYQAGQYLQIFSRDNWLNYSIANAPLGSHKYELHIRHSNDNLCIQALLAEIKQAGSVTLRLPFGSCHLNKLHPKKPILFLAQGTGFAPINAMIEQLLATSDARAFELFWSARSQSDLYMSDKVLQWQTHVAPFRYFSLLSNNTTKETLISTVLKQHDTDLTDWQVVIAGPFEMAYTARDILIAHGLPTMQLFSDAFSFEKKES